MNTLFVLERLCDVLMAVAMGLAGALVAAGAVWVALGFCIAGTAAAVASGTARWMRLQQGN